MTRITLSDGSVISGLEETGNMYYSKSPIDYEELKRKLSRVKVTSESDGEVRETEYSNMELAGAQKIEGVAGLESGYYFGLKEITGSELEILKLTAEVAYLRLMNEE